MACIFRVEDEAEQDTSMKAGAKQSSLKHRLTFSGLHGVISQKVVVFISPAMRTSNPT
jgi:hypothetical protein